MNKNGTNGSAVRVGVLGLGRSGWNIHCATLREMTDRFRVVAVADPMEARREQAEAELGCQTFAEPERLIGEAEIDLLVVASPNRMHAAHATRGLETGRHVLVEKPMAMSVDEADTLIETAERCGRLLAPFQNRRYEPHFQQVMKIIRSGVLGQIVQVRLAWHSFGRRWDWQTLKEFGGGLLNNNGPHLIDHALEVFGPTEPRVWVDLQRVLTSGDAEDHIKLVLHGEGAPTVDVELTSACAYPQDRWHIMGSAGALRGNEDALEWKTVDWSTLPPRPLDRTPTPDRSYNKETLPWVVNRWEKPANTPREYTAFYQDLHESIAHGRPLVVSPESVRRQLAVIAACRELCPI
jgi:scyllo-inositol 2-dehydrogenase (NADP+)